MREQRNRETEKQRNFEVGDCSIALFYWAIVFDLKGEKKEEQRNFEIGYFSASLFFCFSSFLALKTYLVSSPARLY